MQFHQAKSKIISICRKLNQKNYIAAGDGNVSFKISDHEILITPSGINKSEMQPSEIAALTIHNESLAGHPSSERLMHIEVYKRCPMAKAVVHAHPPTAVAWTIAHPDLKELPAECMSELILSAGGIPIVPYARPGTNQMAEVLAPFLPNFRVMILARHGAISWGETLDEAYNGIERIEHSAIILKAASELGGLTFLNHEEVSILRQIRSRLGNKTL
ncbi:MAG: class II aldolase/adducin family protein [Bdellovibrionota bacterium]